MMDMTPADCCLCVLVHLILAQHVTIDALILRKTYLFLCSCGPVLALLPQKLWHVDRVGFTNT